LSPFRAKATIFINLYFFCKNIKYTFLSATSSDKTKIHALACLTYSTRLTNFSPLVNFRNSNYSSTVNHTSFTYSYTLVKRFYPMSRTAPVPINHKPTLYSITHGIKHNQFSHCLHKNNIIQITFKDFQHSNRMKQDIKSSHLHLIPRNKYINFRSHIKFIHTCIHIHQHIEINLCIGPNSIKRWTQIFYKIDYLAPGIILVSNPINLMWHHRNPD
jgi:hypothetical protein